MTLAVLIVSIASLAASFHWLADLLANLRIQQLIGLVTAAAIAVFVKQYRLLLVNAISLALMLPFLSQLLPARAAESRGEFIRLMTINVLTSNRNHQRILAEIKRIDPDVLSILELSTELDNEVTTQLTKAYPHRISRPQDRGNFGIGLYSKHPVASSDVFRLNSEIESIEATILNMRIIATHPLPPMGERGFAMRNEHLEGISQRVMMAKANSPEIPVIVMGDLNLTPWSPHYDAFQRRTRLRRARTGFAIEPTWYSGASVFPFGLVLDHVLTSEQLRCVHYEVGGDVGSDHRAVIVELTQ